MSEKQENARRSGYGSLGPWVDWSRVIPGPITTEILDRYASNVRRGLLSCAMQGCCGGS